ncbi:MAG: DUF2141 domain-containing protein [Polyangiaceae bacterium]|nr:DUF2141 domain-containing protein [Polyangiaceae bacterium]
MVTGFESSKGHLLISLHDSKKTFPGDAAHALQLARVPINPKETVVSLKPVPPGNYAISIFQDENDNEKLDRNLIGIPKEPFGASNNAKAVFGPPKWKDAVFQVSPKGTTQRIRLRRL